MTYMTRRETKIISRKLFLDITIRHFYSTRTGLFYNNRNSIYTEKVAATNPSIHLFDLSVQIFR